MKNNATKRIVIAAMLAALTCVATMIIKIPSPLKGYVNLGDGMVLIAGWTLNSTYGFLAAGLGSALADLFSGYALYAPATFLIKGAMALVAFFLFNLLNKKFANLTSRVIAGFVAELVMIVGYYVFEGFLYGFGASLVNIPANCVQAVAGLIIGCVVVKIFEKIKTTL